MSRSNSSSSIWAPRIATIAGIPIRLHFTFVLFLAWLAAAANQQKQDAEGIALIPAIFFCVLLHELGHALVAKRFGIKTRDITLYPIGGVAMIEGRPKPKEEFWIAVAGPAVNVVIAGVITLVLLATGSDLPKLDLGLGRQGFIRDLVIANAFIVVFNMVPAFPMDGGRVLRAVLAMLMPNPKATQIAGVLGQLLAMAFGIAGVFTGNILWMVIALFVFLGAGQEVSATLAFSLVEHRRVRDAMLTQFRTIAHGETLNTAWRMLLDGNQDDFPVVYGSETLGLLTKGNLYAASAAGRADDYVADHIIRDFRRLPPDAPLEVALEMFSGQDRTAILVMDGDQLVGMLTPENLGEFMMREQTLARSAQDPTRG